jgi:hypothetical protein
LILIVKWHTNTYKIFWLLNALPIKIHNNLILIVKWHTDTYKKNWLLNALLISLVGFHFCICKKQKCTSMFLF